MYLIFVDECGYQKNWPDEQAARDQPFHVVSGVVVRSSHLSAIYTSIRSAVAQLGLPETEPEALGKGQEIKASWIDKGQGFWRENPFLRGKVREIYLNLDQDKVTYFLVCIDKKAHMEHYAVPKDPSKLALQYLLERLQKFLQEMGDNGYVLIDLNRGQETEQREFLAELHRDGSSGIVMGFYGDIYEWKLEMNNIVESTSETADTHLAFRSQILSPGTRTLGEKTTEILNTRVGALSNLACITTRTTKDEGTRNSHRGKL
jgi:hypothetical protein